MYKKLFPLNRQTWLGSSSFIIPPFLLVLHYASSLSLIYVSLSLSVSGLCNFVTCHDYILGGAGSKEQVSISYIGPPRLLSSWLSNPPLSHPPCPILLSWLTLLHLSSPSLSPSWTFSSFFWHKPVHHCHQEAWDNGQNTRDKRQESGDKRLSRGTMCPWYVLNVSFWGTSI